MKSELHEQILEKLYRHRDAAEYVTLTEAFNEVNFQLLYEKVEFLQQSKLIEFYTAPTAYAVFKEPDFIRAKIRTEGIQYYKDHYSFFEKHKSLVRIVMGALALMGVGYIINISIIQNQNVLSGNSFAEQPRSTVPDDSTGAKSKEPLTISPSESRLPTQQDTTKPKKIINQMEEQQQGDTFKVESHDQNGGVTTGRIGKLEIGTPGDQIGEIDLKNNYTMELDTLNHLIKVSPKVGKWDSTVLAIPLNELESVQPEFRSQRNDLSDGRDFAFDAMGQRFSGVLSIGAPASKDLYYTFHYANKPTLFLFGSYPNNLYPHYFK